MRLGIDFGTTRTVVVAALDGRYPIASFDVNGGFEDYLPGVIATQEGALLCGWDALDALHTRRGQGVAAQGAVRALKRVVSTLAPDQALDGLPGTALSALDATTRYLAYVRDMIRTRSNLDLAPDEPLEAVVAVPANASTRQRYLTLDAFAHAGFAVLGMVNEPTAGAIEFAHRNLSVLGRRSPKRYMVVYDLGGGTFDASAVSLTERRFELLATEGIARLGGEDFDEILLDLALEANDAAAQALPPATRAAALEACREAKETLHASTRKVLVDLGRALPQGDGGPVVVEAAALYERCQPLIDRTVDMVQRLFEQLPAHGVDPDNPRELGGLYLVGGATAFPPVGRTLRALYKRKLQLAPQPHAATAVGLAICADPGAGVFVREAVTRHFGVWREAEAGYHKVFDRILSKGTLPGDGAPIVIQRVYRPTHDIGILRFLECTALTADGQPAGDITPWTRVLFPYDPALADRDDLAGVPVRGSDALGGEEIAETYTYDRDGTVTVDIENRTRGYKRHFLLGSLR